MDFNERLKIAARSLACEGGVMLVNYKLLERHNRLFGSETKPFHYSVNYSKPHPGIMFIKVLPSTTKGTKNSKRYFEIDSTELNPEETLHSSSFIVLEKWRINLDNFASADQLSFKHTLRDELFNDIIQRFNKVRRAR
ncbi:MAG: hypothetical protein SCALA702_02170 [Melioribacteraceae bacterium]|nr:MAG: hypothetical protein SCALA702_02170 [Melioribacteraceae bacterium]